MRRFAAEAAALVVKYGGSLSGEHGDGQAKAEFLPIMYGPELMQAFVEFKRIWDPENRMNPGKLVSVDGQVNRADENLRYGPGYRPVTPATRLAFHASIGPGFARALARRECLGLVELIGMQRAVGEHGHEVRLHFHHPARDVEELLAVAGLHAHGARPEVRQKRRMPRRDADLAHLRGREHHLGVAREDFAFGAHDVDMNGHRSERLPIAASWPSLRPLRSTRS